MSDIMGNDQVLSLLKYCLDQAETKKIDYAAVLLHEQPGILTGGRAGLAEMEPNIVLGLRQSADAIEKDIETRKKPTTNPDLDSSWVCYNVASNAMSYDFATWLLVAEMVRRKDKSPEPLKVGLWRGENGKLGLEEPSRRQFFDNVVKPLVPLIGVEDPEAVHGRDTYYTHGDLIDMYHQGVEVPFYRTTPEYLDKVRTWLRGLDNVITITLRETSTWAHRNSNMEAWCKFADYVRDQGYNPIIVRDTSIAESRIPGQMICPEASRDINFRLGLQELSKANFCISNGPASILYTTPWPWVMLIEVTDDSHWYFPNTETNWRDKMKVPKGTQYPWAKDNQRIVWGKDTYENILHGWEQIVPHL